MAKYWKQPNTPVEELNKLWYNHTLECYAALKNDAGTLQELIWRDS